MTTYRVLTLRDLIDKLRALPQGAMVNGMGWQIDSYRGYYERNAVEPGEFAVPPFATELASSYENQIGKPIEGYKGGDYTVSDDELVYLAGDGDTGPAIIGFENVYLNTWRPVLLAESWRY